MIWNLFISIVHIDDVIILADADLFLVSIFCLPRQELSMLWYTYNNTGNTTVYQFSLISTAQFHNLLQQLAQSMQCNAMPLEIYEGSDASAQCIYDMNAAMNRKRKEKGNNSSYVIGSISERSHVPRGPF